MGITQWFTHFPYARVQNLVADMSDHSTILLNNDHEEERRMEKIFRFNNRWLLEPGLSRGGSK